MVVPRVLAPFHPLPRRRWFAGLLLTLLTLTGLACQAAESLVPEPLPQIVKIGLAAPFEGRYRYVGYDAVYAARLAVREVNAAGGVAGRRLELVAYDDRGTAEMGARVAHNLVVDPDVLVVIGHYRAESSAAAAPIYTEAGLPQIVLGGWVSTAPPAIHLMPGPERVAEAMVAVGLEGGAQSVALWADAAADPVLAEALQQAVAASSLAMAATDADFVLSALAPVAAAEQLAAWDASGWEGRLVGAGELAASAFAQVGGAASAGTEFIMPYPFPGDLDGSTAAWVAAYQAVGPHVPVPGPYALPTYEAVGLVADALATALRETRVPDRRALGDALSEGRRSGYLGEIRLDAQGMWQSAPLYRYRWGEAGPELLEILP
ncbi:MAG: ABC transporter substrate-binding protein [Anaerolineae bacterium]|nr:ABC transporter substrate-binding protein [Anaerolineae bacterium]